MKQLLYFLIGFLISLVSALPYLHADPTYDLSNPASWADGASAYTWIYLGQYSDYASASSAISSYDSTYSSTPGIFSINGSQMVFTAIYWNGVQIIYAVYEIASFYEDLFYDSTQEAADSDDDGIADGLDAYPDEDKAYQFRILTNIFDADGNCVAQMIVTSSGDYVLLGDLTAEEINSGLYETGIYTSDFVNSPIWIDSSDLTDDNASDIYSAGESTTTVNSTTAASLVEDAVNTTAGTTTTANGITSGTTYDAGTDTDSTATGKVVDNTAAIASNQKVLADYTKKLSQIQSISNALSTAQSIQLAKVNSTLEDQAKAEAEEQAAQEAEATEAVNEFNNTSVESYYNTENYNGTLTPETDYSEAQELDELSWFTDFFSNNPLKTALNASGFELSSSACELSFTIEGMGTHELSLCEFADGFETAGNLLLSFTSLLALIIVAWR